MNDSIDRDSRYRIAALECAIQRAAQDGGLEGGFDLFGVAEQYYQWLRGSKEANKPEMEKRSDYHYT